MDENNGQRNSLEDLRIVPYFSGSRELYVASGKEVMVYNAFSGAILGSLNEHDNKIICILKFSAINGEDQIILCDKKGKLSFWPTEFSSNYKPTIQFLKLHQNESISHFSTHGSDIFYSTIKYNIDKAVVFCSLSTYDRRSPPLMKHVFQGQEMVAVSANKELIAAVTYRAIKIMKFQPEQSNKAKTWLIKTGLRQATCIKFHPTQLTLTSGNKDGSICLWNNLYENPVETKLHWHTRPVMDFCFSYEGNDIYSVGDECVLVRWQLKNDNNKSFIPRLGAPLKKISTDPECNFAAILHVDNSISIIDTKEMQLEGKIKSISFHVQTGTEKVLSTGLLHHSPTDSLVKNGHTGHLQFFNGQNKRVNYNLDITMNNFLTAERHQKMANTEVSKAGLSLDGTWLVTCETCCLTSDFVEVVLKFWFFNLKSRSWELNTSIQQAHDDVINSIELNNDNQNFSCVTCSNDRKYKIWQLNEYLDISGKKRLHWDNRIVRDYRNLNCNCGIFSADCSMLAVGFGHCITLWNTDSYSLLHTLSQSFLTRPILDIKFGYSGDSFSKLVCRSEEYICSWDLLSSSLLWRVFVASTCLIQHPTSGVMAIFTKNREIFLFEPSSNEPLLSCSDSSENKIISAIFCHKSEDFRIFCFDEQQNFLSIDKSNFLKYPKDDFQNETDADPLCTNNDAVEIKDTSSRNLFTSLSAKEKSVAKSNLNLHVVEKNLTKPQKISVDHLLEALNETSVSTLSLFGIVDSVEKFLPDIDPNYSHSSEVPTYTTIHEDDENDTLSELNEKNALHAVTSLNFDKLYNYIKL